MTSQKKQQYGLTYFISKNKLNYLCKECGVSINDKSYPAHIEHNISITQSNTYTLVKLTDYYKDIKKLTKELNTVIDIIKECCLHVIDNINKVTYIVIPELINSKFKVDSIPVPFDKENYITYRNRYDEYITITLLEEHEQDNERYKNDLKYLYVYTLNRLRLYFSVNENNEVQANSNIIWKYVKELKNSYLIKCGLNYDKWYEFIFTPAFTYFKDEWKDNKDQFYSLYNNLTRISELIIKDHDKKFDKTIERKNKTTAEDIADKVNKMLGINVINLNKVGLKAHNDIKIDKVFKAYLSALVKLYLYGNNANVSLRGISLISGLSYPTVQKYTKLLIDTNVIHDRTNSYKFTDRVLNDVKASNNITEVVLPEVQNVETYDNLLTLYKIQWKAYYTRIINLIQTTNPKQSLKVILNNLINNKVCSFNSIEGDKTVIDNIQVEGIDYMHREYIYNLVIKAKTLLARLDEGICTSFINVYYGKVKSLLIAINKRLSKNKNKITEGINYEIMINNANIELGYYEQVTLMDEMRRVIVEELKVVKKWHYMRKKMPKNILDTLDVQRGKFVDMLQNEEYRVRF